MVVLLPKQWNEFSICMTCKNLLKYIAKIVGLNPNIMIVLVEVNSLSTLI